MGNSYSFDLVADWRPYLDYLSVETPGEVAVVKSPYNPEGWAIIFTDRAEAGGVATAPGQDNDFANSLALYWVECAKRGEKPGDVFDTLTTRYGADEVAFYDSLRDLSNVTGVLAEE